MKLHDRKQTQIEKFIHDEGICESKLFIYKLYNCMYCALYIEFCILYIKTENLIEKLIFIG